MNLPFDNDTRTIVQKLAKISRGIGNSIIPFGFNNCPEIVLVELNAQ